MIDTHIARGGDSPAMPKLQGLDAYNSQRQQGKTKGAAYDAFAGITDYAEKKRSGRASGGRARRAEGGSADDSDAIDLSGDELDQIDKNIATDKKYDMNLPATVGAGAFNSQRAKGKNLRPSLDAWDGISDYYKKKR